MMIVEPAIDRNPEKKETQKPGLVLAGHRRPWGGRSCGGLGAGGVRLGLGPGDGPGGGPGDGAPAKVQMHFPAGQFEGTWLQSRLHHASVTEGETVRHTFADVRTVEPVEETLWWRRRTLASSVVSVVVVILMVRPVECVRSAEDQQQLSISAKEPGS
jgi:hypothetical protein